MCCSALILHFGLILVCDLRILERAQQDDTGLVCVVLPSVHVHYPRHQNLRPLTIPLNVLPSSSVLPVLFRGLPFSVGSTPTRSMTLLSRLTASRYAASAPVTSFRLSISTALCARSSAVCNRCLEGVRGGLDERLGPDA